jgi:hypothetical protein
MRKLILAAIFVFVTLPAFALGPRDFVGTWKSVDPAMTRTLVLEGNVIVMTETVVGRSEGQEATIMRKYPTDGSEVTMGPEFGKFADATAKGRMAGNVLTVETVLKGGQRIHDIWTLSPDGQSYTDEIKASAGRGLRGKIFKKSMTLSFTRE